MGTFREPLAEGIEGAPHLGPERPRVYSDLSPKEKDRYNANIRATDILLQGLPKDIYTLINHYTNAKDIWDNVHMLLEGSELTKEDQESQLGPIHEVEVQLGMGEFRTELGMLIQGAENVVADYLSRLEKQNLKELNDEEINDEFLDEFLMSIKADKEESSWFADFANYLVGGILRKVLTYAQRFKHGYLSGYVDLYNTHGGSFSVNGHHVKLYHDDEQLNKLTIEEIHLMFEEGRMKAIPFMVPFPADYRETMPWASEKPYIYSVVESTCNEAKLYDLEETGKEIVIENVCIS
nr:integrase, catalytic region, zinc finger, CCHC-type, peptidase aspartic, catalytic [Tanacetum cinerariifolium]